jgi:hypothetical protein
VTGSATVSPGLVHDRRDQLVQSGPSELAGPADLTLVSTNADGVKANAGNLAVALSADDTKLAFFSSASNLDPEAPNGGVFVKDLTTGELTRLALPPTSEISMSADFTKVALETTATGLDPRDTDSLLDVYVKDLTTGELTLVSTNDDGVKADGHSGSPSLSGDGTKVAFLSRAFNLHRYDGDGKTDLYVKNLRNGNLKWAGRTENRLRARPGDSFTLLSGDGRRVAFSSYDANHPGDAHGDTWDVFVKDLGTGELILASTNDAGETSNTHSFVSSITPDGTRVSFFAGGIAPDDTDFSNDGYVKDLTTGDLILASTTDTGLNVEGGLGAGGLSVDGTRVVVNGRGSLDPADNDGPPRPDAYVKDLVTGSAILASTSDTGVKGNRPSGGALLFSDGTKVVISSQATSLDPADTDDLSDLYVKTLPTIATSLDLAGCSNGQSGTVSVAGLQSFPPRPLGCPQSLGGAAGNDYPDRTPILFGANQSFEIDWASGPNSHGIASVQAGPTGTKWRVRLTITAGPGHDTPSTNQYLPEPGSGFTKTKLKGTADISALDSFRCGGGIGDPLSWLDVANDGSWVALTR